MTADNAWWAGCSLPARVSQLILAKLERHGVVACFLAPPYAAAVREALDRLERRAVITIEPDQRALAVLLVCEDLSTAIRESRLWFAAGPDWANALRDLYDQLPGLPTPAQFIRMPVSDPTALEPLIATSQEVFSAVVSRRAALLTGLRDGWRPPSAPPKSPAAFRLCVVTGSHFRLWDDAAQALAAVLVSQSAGQEKQVRLIDSDQPISSSPLALLHAVQSCDALVTANTARSDLPDLLPLAMPWLTWVTTPRLPAFVPAGAGDRLLVADAAWRTRAIEAGWPADRVAVARWPDLRPRRRPRPWRPPLRKDRRVPNL